MAKDSLEKVLKDHIEKEEIMLDMHEKALFGDEKLNQPGLVEMVSEIHEYFTEMKNAKKVFGRLFGGMGDTFRWLLLVVAIVGIIKGWWLGFIRGL